MQTTHRSLKEKQRQERENLILQVAEEVILEKGYYETSIEEIATRVGIAKGTVYLHFPGKEDLVIAIFQHDMQKFLQGFDAAIASKQTVREKLEALLYFLYTGIFSTHAQLLSVIFNSVDLRRIFTEKGCSLHDFWDNFISRITTILEEGKTSGEVDSSIPTNVMVSAFAGLFSPKSYDRLINGDKMTPDELVKHVGRIYFRGIAAESCR